MDKFYHIIEDLIDIINNHKVEVYIKEISTVPNCPKWEIEKLGRCPYCKRKVKFIE